MALEVFFTDMLEEIEAGQRKADEGYDVKVSRLYLPNNLVFQLDSSKILKITRIAGH
ncbi:MAG: hypothetical protein QM669_05390 [Siphonobacter sp.]